ncbi:hypothetical protein BJY52DRAFT_865832 [Lactarius psammicola]|nr:hypothetical protein BJY52DRAFT_865832 [Lactarius psammicola]
MFSIPSSSDLRTRSFAISSRHLPANSRSLASTSISFPFHSAFNSHPQPSELSHSSVYRPSHAPPKMFYDDHDPRIGPAEMPSPQSEYAPYYSGYADTFEDFLDEFEGRAYDCELTDPQRVDALIRYIDPSIRELCMSLTGFRPRDWPVFRQSLLDTFGHTTPRPQVMRQKLQNYVQGSSERRMECVDDVLQYYRDFLCLSAPIVHSGHLTEEDRDAAFWHGFHPEDRSKLWPRLIGKNPLQPHGIPFHFEDVLSCARGTFAYDGYFSSWTPEHRLKPSSVRREQPVAEHVSRDTCGPREVSRAVVSNAEIENTHSSSELLSPSTPDPQLPTSSSLSATESQYTLAQLATIDHPEPKSTFSNPSPTLPISSSLSISETQHPHTRSAMLDQPENALTFSNSSSTLLPSISLIPSTLSVRLTHSAAEDDFENAPTFSIPSSTLLPSTSSIPTPSLTPSATDDYPERAPTFSNSPSTFLPSASPTQSIFRSLARSAADDVPEIASTPPPFTSITPACPLTLSILSNFEYLPSETEEEPESEPASMSSTTPSSLPLQSTPSFSFPSTDDVPEVTSAPPSSFSKSFDPECMTSVRMAIDDQPEPETAPMSLIPQELDSPTCAPLPPSEPPSRLAVDHAPSPLTFDSSPVLPASSQLPASLLLPFVVGNLELEYVPPSAVDVVPPSSPEPSPSSLSEVILHTPDANLRTRAPILPLGVTRIGSVSHSLEVSPNAPVSPHSSPSQQVLEVTPDDSVLSPFEIMTAPAPPTTPVYQQVLTTQWLLYLVPQLLQEPSLVYEASSTPAPHISTPSPLLRLPDSRSARFDLAFSFVNTVALVSALVDISAAILTAHARKFGSKNKDFGDSQSGTPKTGDTFAQRLRLRQYTPHAPRFVFDPGGLASSLVLESTHENARGRKPKTRGGFVTTHDATLPTLVLVGNRTVFIAKTLNFFSRRSLTGDGQDLNPPGGVRPARALSPKLDIRHSHVSGVSCFALICTLLFSFSTSPCSLFVLSLLFLP